MAAVLVGLAVLAAYLLPGLSDPGARWPLWDARVYWWGGQQAARGAALYAPGGRYNFTYPPFAASLFRLGAAAPEGWVAAVITAGSIAALVGLCWQALGAAGVRRWPAMVFAVAALALLTWPVDYTLHLGEVDLIVAALVGADLLARRDGGRWQGIATGLAAGIKLTPLIFVVGRCSPVASGRPSPPPRASPPPSSWDWSCCPPSPAPSGWTGRSATRAASATRPTRPTSRCPGRSPGSPEAWTGQGMVARGGAADRAGRDRGRRVGARARPPAGRRGGSP